MEYTGSATRYLGLPARRCSRCGGVEFGVQDGLPACSTCEDCVCVIRAESDGRRLVWVDATQQAANFETTCEVESEAVLTVGAESHCLERTGCGYVVLRGSHCLTVGQAGKVVLRAEDRLHVSDVTVTGIDGRRISLVPRSLRCLDCDGEVMRGDVCESCWPSSRSGCTQVTQDIRSWSSRVTAIG